MMVTSFQKPKTSYPNTPPFAVPRNMKTTSSKKNKTGDFFEKNLPYSTHLKKESPDPKNSLFRSGERERYV
jgi:hypothetical protein